MMNHSLTLSLLLVCCFGFLGNAIGQERFLEGLWEGEMTVGGLESQQGLRFELLLTTEGRQLSGRSYVYLQDGEVIEMKISGYWYQDQSLYLEDSQFLPAEGSSAEPVFGRKYQFLFKPSIFGTTLEGYWQQIIPEPFFEGRDRGRILLKKVKITKA